ncbi:MAG: hypothetical protein DLM55_06720 [Acidimicrobiales bacterium]|nr:MAG: hypothetical protein DLM55_06720 [Acidimicrobiales bacterium]
MTKPSRPDDDPKVSRTSNPEPGASHSPDPSEPTAALTTHAWRPHPSAQLPAEAGTPPRSAAGYPPGPPTTVAPAAAYPPHHHGSQAEPPRDRVWPHLLWELLLAVGAAVLFVAYRQHGSPGFDSDDYKPVWFWASLLGLLAMGLSFSLRVGAPNLAVGSTFLAAGVLAGMFYHERSWSAWPSVAAAVGVAALAGLLLGAIVSVLHVPAWVASLGAALALLAWTVNTAYADKTRLLTPVHGPNLFSHWEWIFLGIAGVSVIGGTFGAVSGLRRSWGAGDKADAAKRPNAVGVLATLAGFIVSSALAAVAGGLAWIGITAHGSTPTLSAASDPGSDLLSYLFSSGGLVVLVLAVVLVGGVSAFGRRGGIFGTMLATLVMVLLVVQPIFDFNSPYNYMYIIAGALLLGLVVTRVLEASGSRTPKSPVPDSYADAALGQW